MNVITIIKNELKLIVRNRVNFIILLTMPIAMIALMGYAMKPFFTAEEKGIEKFDVLYLNNDHGSIGRSFDEFIMGDENLYFNIVKADSQDIEGELIARDMDEAIVVPEKLTEKLASGEDVNLIHISSGKNIISSNVVESFLGAFKDTTNVGINIQNVIKSYDLNTQEASSIRVDFIDKYGTSFVNTRSISKQDPINLGSFQYFSVSMLIFFLLTSGMGLGIGIIDDRTDRLYSRISSYPVTNNQYLLGKALGNGVIGIFQAAIIIIFTSLAFKVDWGNNYSGLAIVVIAVLFSSSGLAVILSNLLNSSKALSTALIVIYWCITFVSGAFTPIPAFEPAGRFTLNKWAFEAITGFMAGKGFGYAANYLLMLITLCLILWVIGIMLYRRRAANE